LIDEVDFLHLNARFKRKSAVEDITEQWPDLILEKHPVGRS
jgi:hypothetical protein